MAETKTSSSFSEEKNERSDPFRLERRKKGNG